MKKAVKWALAVALGLSPVGANAAIYDFNFSTTDSLFSATGAITTADTLDAIGGYDILSISGTIFGPGFGPTGAGIAFAPNPSQPYPANNPIYQYDNVYFPGGSAPFDANGILFTVGGYDYNLYSDGPTAYLSTDNPAGVYFPGAAIAFSDPVQDSVMSAPEPSTWALILLGFAGLGLAARRKTRERNAALALQPVGLGRKA
jgi:hypothetical protein